jgi:hypothetical protein
VPANVSLEFYHDSLWHRLDIVDTNMTNIDGCYEVDLNYTRASAFDSDMFWDAERPTVVSTFPPRHLDTDPLNPGEENKLTGSWCRLE